MICTQCISSCRTCAKGSPATCVDCGDGAYLDSLNTGKCKPCSPNCKTCSSKGCNECWEGFNLNEQMTCSENCV